MTGELHGAIGDMYTQYLDIPENIVSRGDFKPLETAYRNYEANATVANAAAFLDAADGVQAKAVGGGYSIDNPDSPAKRAMLGNAAQAMASDIGRAIATGQLSAAEVSQLQGVLAGLTGSADLAQAYVGLVMSGADAASEKVRSYGRESVSSLRRKRTPAGFDTMRLDVYN